MGIVVYPGSFDPITNGHVDIIRRAATLFDRLVIGVYDRPDKVLLFSVEQRADMVRGAITDLPNVFVETYDGLTVDFVQRMSSKTMIRGLRMNSDFEKEFEMAEMNKKLAPNVELLCLMTTHQYQCISSSLIKEVVRSGGSVAGMVPDHVEWALREKFSCG